MNVLGIDTSGDRGSVGLVSGAAPDAEETFGAKGRHEASLLPASRRLLERAGLAAKDLQAIAVGIGPGSYTGVRIAVSFAKTLAFALRVPLFGVSGLAALAWDARKEAAVIGVLEPGHAGRGYAGAFRVSGVLPESVIAVDLRDAAEFVAALPGDAALAGREAPAHAPAAAARGLRLAVPGPDGVRVSALTLARLGAAMLAAGASPSDPFALEPLYLQPAAPERKR